MSTELSQENVFLPEDEFQRRLAELKQKVFPVLSKGSIQLIDVMGDDRRVVMAARTTSGLIAKTDSEDENLIRFLRRHRHTTPSEFVELVFKVVIPMDAWRQMIRHRTASVNEFSSRYSDVLDRNDTTPPGEWRVQSTANRQGSGGMLPDDFWPENYLIWPLSDDDDMLISYEEDVGFRDEYQADHRRWAVIKDLDPDWPEDREPSENDPVRWEYLHVFEDISFGDITPGRYLSEREGQSHKDTRGIYDERLLFNVAKEQARKDLQLSTYTEAWWKIDLHNLLHYLGLRMDPHAQKEIRDYANIIGNEIVAKLLPVTWQAFLDYQLNAMTLSALDIEIMQNLNSLPDHDAPYSWDDFVMCLPRRWRGLKRSRERDECWEKLKRTKLVAGEIPKLE